MNNEQLESLIQAIDGQNYVFKYIPSELFYLVLGAVITIFTTLLFNWLEKKKNKNNIKKEFNSRIQVLYFTYVDMRKYLSENISRDEPDNKLENDKLAPNGKEILDILKLMAKEGYTDIAALTNLTKTNVFYLNSSVVFYLQLLKFLSKDLYEYFGIVESANQTKITEATLIPFLNAINRVIIIIEKIIKDNITMKDADGDRI